MTNEDIHIAGEYVRFRNLHGWLNVLVKGILIAIPIVACFFIMDCPFYLNWTILMEQFYGIMAAMILPLVFILIPISQKAPRNRVPWYDFVLALLSIMVGFYVALYYGQILRKLGDVTPDRVIVGTIALALILEASRRTINLFIAVFGLLFILLPHLSFLLPELFSGIRIPFDQQINYLFLDTNGILSLMFGLVVTQILGFTLFGNLIQGGGGGAFITDFAMGTFGGVRGGPAKVSVVASGLFGTISGSAVANVVVDGWLTIPTMIRTGYRPHVAAAIEAVASTGGQIMPPVMGVTAFVMAEVIGVPYYKVAIAAAIPAILYYVAIFFQVDMEAGKTGLKGLPREQLPNIFKVLRKIHLFIIPFAALMICLFFLYWPPDKSALAAVLPIMILGFLVQKETRFRLGWVFKAFQQAGIGMLIIGPVGLMCGIIIGTVSYTGLGFLLSLNIIKIAGGNLFLLLIITAIVCFILGMAMPSLPAYVLLAVLVAPAVVQLGIDIMAAHLFIFYFACIALITPPVAPAAYAAAAIVGANPMRTGWTASRFAVIAYIIPFLFVFFPGLLLRGSPVEIVITFVTAVFGCFLLAAALTGYLYRDLSPIKRIILTVVGVGLLVPIQSHLLVFGLIVNIACGGLALFLIAREWKQRSKDEFVKLGKQAENAKSKE